MKKIFVTILAIFFLPINIFAAGEINAPQKLIASKINNTYKFEMDKANNKNLNIEIDVLNNGKWASQDKKSIIKKVNESGAKNSITLTDDELKNFASNGSGYSFRLRYVANNKTISPFTHTIHLGDSPISRNSSAWALDDINKASSLNIVPNSMISNMKAGVTREELAEVAVKAYRSTHNKTAQGSIDHFKDTENKYANIAFDLGLMSGVGEDKFNPKGHVTREDYAVVASKIFGMKSVKSIRIKDEKDISKYAKDSVYSALNSKILTLDKDLKFNPKKEMKREEVLSSIVRNMQK